MHQFTLYELTQYLKEILRQHLETSYWVVAEIGEMRFNQKGHCYLELVDKKGDQLLAKAKATIWSSTYKNLSQWFTQVTGERIRTGMKILANVNVQFHEIYGLSLNIRDVDPRFTLGERARFRLQVLKRLKSEGVYGKNKLLRLPSVIQNLAIISSPLAAGLQDFIHQLKHNPPAYHFKTEILKAQMQGEDASASIMKALERRKSRGAIYDAVILIRGGGSALDLDCFDNYELAVAIATFPLPVITGIGHERDETVADMVAHTKLKTPTAVSEFLIDQAVAFEKHLTKISRRLFNLSATKIQAQKSWEEEYKRRLTKGYEAAVREERMKVVSLKNAVRYHYELKLNSSYSNYKMLAEKTKKAGMDVLKENRRFLGHLEKVIRNLEPSKVLRRGFSITKINNQCISEEMKLKNGDAMSTETHWMKINSKITQYRKK